MTDSANAHTAPVALVTGGARRIGAAICRHLHAQGFRVLVHYHHSAGEAQALVAECNRQRPDSAAALAADLNLNDQVRRLAEQSVAQWSRLDVLINNASSFFPTPIGEADETAWDQLLNSNLKAPFFLSQYVVPALRASRGCIINISDIFAVRPMPKHTLYSIAKAGNRMLTQSLALEMAPDVRVNGVAPGAILWPENSQGHEVVNPQKLERIPMGCLGGAHTIAETVFFLINNAPYITGQIIAVDGGRSLQQ